MKTLLVSHKDGIALLVLNQPKSLNALNSQAYQELTDALSRIEEDNSIKVVILTGQGDTAFAAGADISEMKQLDGEAGRSFSQLSQRPAQILASMRQVTIAAVNGYALGGGFELSLACDLCIAAEHAVFAFPEVGLGIIPSGGGTQRLTQLVGLRRAKEIIFTGHRLTANEAKEMGIVNQVVPGNELLDRCCAIAGDITKNSTYAISLAKRSINASLDLDIINGCIQESELQGLAFSYRDKDERMQAFLQNTRNKKK